MSYPILILNFLTLVHSPLVRNHLFPFFIRKHVLNPKFPYTIFFFKQSLVAWAHLNKPGALEGTFAQPGGEMLPGWGWGRGGGDERVEN